LAKPIFVVILVVFQHIVSAYSWKDWHSSPHMTLEKH